MTADMRGDFGKLNFIDFIVLVSDMLKVMLPVEGNHRHFILIQEQESGISTDDRFLSGCFPVVDDPSEAFHDLGAHRHIALTAFGFGILDDILHISGTLQLMIHTDSLFVKSISARVSPQNSEIRSPVLNRMKIPS